MQIRPATNDDIDAIVNFSTALALESEQRKLDSKVVRAGVKTLLGGKFGFVLIAVLNKQPVGMIMVGGREWSDWSNGQLWWITGSYVCPEARRSGVGNALYAKVRTLARSAVPKVIGIRGCVHAENTEAHMILESVGRSKSSYVVFEERFDNK